MISEGITREQKKMRKLFEWLLSNGKC